MPRNMSFFMTKKQMYDQTKDMTRRQGWDILEPGSVVMAVEKGQGIKKGELVRIGLIEILTKKKESISDITYADCIREGFPEMSPEDFVSMYCKANKCKPDDLCNVFTFKHLYEKSNPNAEDMKFLFFDYETNGFARTKSPGYAFPNAWPLPLSVAYQLWSIPKDGQPDFIEDYYTIINQPGITPTNYNRQAALVHRISLEQIQRSETTGRQVALQMEKAIGQATVLVAHNLKFDINVLGASLRRYERPLVVNGKSTFCTMEALKGWTKAKDKRGRRKNPNLGEIFRKTFGKEMTGAHNAKEDVDNLVKVFFALRDKGVIFSRQRVSL